MKKRYQLMIISSNCPLERRHFWTKKKAIHEMSVLISATEQGIDQYPFMAHIKILILTNRKKEIKFWAKPINLYHEEGHRIYTNL